MILIILSSSLLVLPLPHFFTASLYQKHLRTILFLSVASGAFI
uniref:Uncharacterized protein n=1 Tax=Arundo donax TaxID=35708 RepID=A0A0A9A6P6_ARUDO